MADALRVSVHFDERHLIDHILMPSLIGCINTAELSIATNMKIDDGYDDNDDDDDDSHSYGHFINADFQFIIEAFGKISDTYYDISLERNTNTLFVIE